MKLPRPVQRIVAALSLAIALVGCHPTPRPVTPGADATVSQPSDVGSTAETIFNYASWALPAINVVVSLLPIPEVAKALIHQGIVFAQNTLLRLHAAVDTYRARGGGTGRCELYAASGASQDALFALVDQIAAAGYQPPIDVRNLIGNLGGILDTISDDPLCHTDAGFRAFGREGTDRLDRVVITARQAGRPLREFPPVHP